MTADSQHCPECRLPIAPDAPRGLCLPCLARTVFFPEPESEPAPHAAPHAAPHPATPRHFGSWQVLRIAGEGAFGVVYEALQSGPVPRRAALKVLKQGLDSREILDRFTTEWQSLAELDHPGIARVLDAGAQDGQPWFAAEWIPDALPITEYCQRHRLTTARRAELFAAVCAAVGHAHLHGIIHRDLKPANLLVDSSGRVKVNDFGIARFTRQASTGNAFATLAGQVLGTPAYMSPEQAAGGPEPVDLRADIYGLGAVLCEMLCGQPPFPRGRLENLPMHEALELVRTGEPLRPSSQNPELRGAWDWIILKALSKDPARRYETAAALGRDLTAWREGTTLLAAPPSRPYQLRLFLRRHRAAALGTAAVFLALALGLIGTTTMSFRARSRAEEARVQSLRAAAGEAAARRNASLGDQQTARTLFDRGEPVEAALLLARAVRSDPLNHAAAERLLSELVFTDFPRPAWPPRECPEFIRQLVFSPDSSRLAVRGSELDGGFAPGSLTLLDTLTGEPLPKLINRPILGLAFSPDGQFLATSEPSGYLTFCRTSDGSTAPCAALPHPHPIRGVTWGTTGRLTTLEDKDKNSTGRLWDVSDGKKPRLLGAVPGIQALTTPAWSPDKTRLAWRAADGTVTLMRTADGSIVKSFPTPGGGEVAFTGNGTLAVLTYESGVRLYSAWTGKPVSERVQAGTNPLFVEPSPDGTVILTTGMDGPATLWDPLDLITRHTFSGRWNRGKFSPGGDRLILSGEWEDHVVLYNMDNMRPACPPIPLPGKGAQAALSPDGRWLACGGRRRELRVFDIRPASATGLLPAITAPVIHLGWSADGQTLLGLHANAPPAARTRQGRPLPPDSLPNWTDAVLTLAAVPEHGGVLRLGSTPFPPNARPGDLIPTEWRDGLPASVVTMALVTGNTATLVFVENGTILHAKPLHPAPGFSAPAPLTLPAAVSLLTSSRDGASLALSLQDGSLLHLKTSSLQPLSQHPRLAAKATSLAILTDSRIAVGGADGSLRLSPDPSASGPGPAALTELSLTPDGRFLITGDAENAARIHDAATGEPLSPPLRHRSIADRLTGVVLRVSPDGKWLATGGCHDDIIRLRALPSGREAHILQHLTKPADFQFDSTGTRLISLSSNHGGCVVQCWDTASGLPLLPPKLLHESGPGSRLALPRDGSQAAVILENGKLLLVDLPPILSNTPSWLADFAEARIGWHLDPAGLPEATPMLPGATPIPTGPPGLDPWVHWLLTPPAARPPSPLGPAPFPDRTPDPDRKSAAWKTAPGTDPTATRHALSQAAAALRFSYSRQQGSIRKTYHFARLALLGAPENPEVIAPAVEALHNSVAPFRRLPLLVHLLFKHPRSPATAAVFHSILPSGADLY